MWLVYFRFQDGDQVQTYHIRTSDKRSVDELQRMAEQHGLTRTARLVEYAAFISSGTIKLKPMIVPNFHFYLHEEWQARWTQADAPTPPQ